MLMRIASSCGYTQNRLNGKLNGGRYLPKRGCFSTAIASVRGRYAVLSIKATMDAASDTTPCRSRGCRPQDPRMAKRNRSRLLPLPRGKRKISQHPWQRSRTASSQPRNSLRFLAEVDGALAGDSTLKCSSRTETD